MMDIEKRCEIIEQFVREYAGSNESIRDEEYITFMAYNDLGVPLSQALTHNLINLTESGKIIVNETWTNFCDMIGIQVNGEYDSIYEIFDEFDSSEE